jgi:hypothetical protein
MTNNKAKNFAKTAKAAAQEAVGSRQELGRACATEFAANPDTFNPIKLMVLGRPGLRAFADALGVAIIDVAPDVPTAGTTSPAGAEEAGWSLQESRGIRFERMGMLTGIFFGIVVIAAASLAAWLQT